MGSMGASQPEHSFLDSPKYLKVPSKDAVPLRGAASPNLSSAIYSPAKEDTTCPVKTDGMNESRQQTEIMQRKPLSPAVQDCCPMSQTQRSVNAASCSFNAGSGINTSKIRKGDGSEPPKESNVMEAAKSTRCDELQASLSQPDICMQDLPRTAAEESNASPAGELLPKSDAGQMFKSPSHILLSKGESAASVVEPHSQEVEMIDCRPQQDRAVSLLGGQPSARWGINRRNGTEGGLQKDQ